MFLYACKVTCYIAKGSSVENGELIVHNDIKEVCSICVCLRFL